MCKPVYQETLLITNLQTFGSLQKAALRNIFKSYRLLNLWYIILCEGCKSRNVYSSGFSAGAFGASLTQDKLSDFQVFTSVWACACLYVHARVTASGFFLFLMKSIFKVTNWHHSKKLKCPVKFPINKESERPKSDVPEASKFQKPCGFRCPLTASH